MASLNNPFEDMLLSRETGSGNLSLPLYCRTKSIAHRGQMPTTSRCVRLSRPDGGRFRRKSRAPRRFQRPDRNTAEDSVAPLTLASSRMSVSNSYGKHRPDWAPTLFAFLQGHFIVSRSLSWGRILSHQSFLNSSVHRPHSPSWSANINDQRGCSSYKRDLLTFGFPPGRTRFFCRCLRLLTDFLRPITGTSPLEVTRLLQEDFRSAQPLIPVK